MTSGSSPGTTRGRVTRVLGIPRHARAHPGSSYPRVQGDLATSATTSLSRKCVLSLVHRHISSHCVAGHSVPLHAAYDDAPCFVYCSGRKGGWCPCHRYIRVPGILSVIPGILSPLYPVTPQVRPGPGYIWVQNISSGSQVWVSRQAGRPAGRALESHPRAINGYKLVFFVMDPLVFLY
jgi:hypothetical protein